MPRYTREKPTLTATTTATILAIHHRLAPPTINLDNLDPQVELDIPTTARELRGGDIAALNNSFGFGGANVAVAFGSV